MQAQQNLSELQFVNLHVVDKNYHELHSQLLHKHEDVLELFYIMQGDGQYIVGGKEYIIRPGNLVICNEDILHGEAPFCSREMESYCCVVRGLHLAGAAAQHPDAAGTEPDFILFRGPHRSRTYSACPVRSQPARRRPSGGM